MPLIHIARCLVVFTVQRASTLCGEWFGDLSLDFVSVCKCFFIFHWSRFPCLTCKRAKQKRCSGIAKYTCNIDMEPLRWHFFAILRPKSNFKLVYDLPESGRSVTQLEIRPLAPSSEKCRPTHPAIISSMEMNNNSRFWLPLQADFHDLDDPWILRKYCTSLSQWGAKCFLILQQTDAPPKKSAFFQVVNFLFFVDFFSILYKTRTPFPPRILAKGGCQVAEFAELAFTELI